MRDGDVVFATEPLQHEFNMPYQLAAPSLLPVTDYPSSAAVSRPEVRCHDILILGSDGLFDNMWDDDLEDVVRGYAARGARLDEAQLAELADALAAEAAAHSQDKLFKSPWSVATAQSGQVGLLRRMFPKGGKLDDITVVVAQLRAGS